MFELNNQTFAETIEALPLAFVCYHSSAEPLSLSRCQELYAQVQKTDSDLFVFSANVDESPLTHAGVTIPVLPFVAVFRYGKLIDSIANPSTEGFLSFVDRMKLRTGAGAA